MSSTKLHPPNRDSTQPNPLPQLLQTPSGLAILELQGTINLPRNADGEALEDDDFSFGRLDFPLYDPDAVEGSAWMKRVYMYVGQHQRLAGEVKKLPRALAVVRRRQARGDREQDLEVVEIVKYKLLFAGRPEPVGTEHAPA
ncbi:chromosome transmission fidelity protein 8 [Geosmithia morbida]|uniref:Chromosome transmission fidelity protein 8 n=1 Tax=Geosmithia morbida TaxID=1094350 RepID=A0A9P4YXJ4_9HYPO|nr:chromosome transmission fidelity protein 8 [Geosmithia morbida]KAF4123637.1 chromosome transmission fidelity protein 8 [Geosmithia morbida]